ncbi:MAG: helix-turn-helix domain-containing protein [Chloroflexota bacterium]|nr:helix-turn-helix domain-containing protein [Chloroflexota bacterium]
MTTLSDLLREKLAGHGRLVGGEGGAGATVSWVVTARTRTPSLDPLQGGEVVLVPPTALSYLGGEERLASLLPGFREAGASAVCVWTEPDEEARSSADRVGLPLISITDTSVAQVERELLDHIAGQMRHGLRQQQDRQTHLLDTLAANRGLDAIIRVLADHVSRRVAYFPAEGYPLTSADAPPSLPADFASRVPEGPEVATIGVKGAGDALWVTPVLHRGARLGALVVSGVPSAPTAAEALSMRQVAAAISVEQGRADAAVEAEQRQRDGFYKDLFAGRSLDTVYGRARTLGVTIPPEGIVVVVAAREPNGSLPEVAKDRLHALLNRQAVYPLLDQGRTLLMLVPTMLRGDSATNLLLRSLAPVAGGTAVGISEPVQDAQRVSEAVEEANTALLVSRRTRDGAPTRFLETGAYGLLAPLRETSIARRVMGQLLQPVITYDRQHNASLTETLETYIACNGNASITAHRLSLHRNSLSYRLKRIEDLTGLSLAESENRLLLTLALRLQKLVQTDQSPVP